MLDLAAALVEPRPDDCGRPPRRPRRRARAGVSLYSQPDPQPDVRAFSWSSLTSGRATTALWLLLLPYVLANVAGWAALELRGGGRSARARWVLALVRISGLLVTALFALFAFVGLADVGARRWLVPRLAAWRQSGWTADSPWNGVLSWVGGWWLLAGAAAAAGLVWLVFHSTRVRLRPEVGDPWSDAVDPAGRHLLHRDQHGLWNHPGIIVRLARLHLGLAWGVVALAAALAHSELTAPGPGADRLAIWLAALACLLPIVLVCVISASRGRLRPAHDLLTRTGAVVAGAAALAAAVLTPNPDPVAGAALETPAAIGAGVVAGLVATSLLAWVVVRGGRAGGAPRGAGWSQPAMIALAAFVGIAFGAGFVSAFADVAAGGGAASPGPAFGWLSVWIAASLAILAVAAGAAMAIAYLRTPAGQPARAMVAVARITEHPLRLLQVLVGAVVAAAAAVAAAWSASSPAMAPELDSPRWLSIPVVVLVVVAASVPAVMFIWRLRSLLSKLISVSAAAAAAAALWWAVESERGFDAAGLELPPHTFLELCELIAFALPTGVVAGRIVTGLRNREARRGVGILWDLGSFWPRWFHPFTPPTYSDVAVTELRDVIDRGAASGSKLVVAPHSQGSIVATAALLYARGPTGCVALLTYGSPWSRLYAQVFSTVFSRACLEAMCERLGSGHGARLRWLNLYRASDPIGGPVATTPPGIPPRWADALARLDRGPLVDRCGRNHSGYTLEDDYRRARSELMADLDGCDPGARPAAPPGSGSRPGRSPPAGFPTKSSPPEPAPP